MKTLLCLAITFVPLASAQDAGQPGAKVASLSATTLDGKSTQFSTAGRITAVVFLSTSCPVSNDYNERMEALYTDYGSKVRFLFLNANFNEPAGEIGKHAKQHGFTFPVYRDVNNVAADLLNAQFTPETYVFGPDGVIKYHGRIDDARDAARITARNLRAALDALLAGKPVAVAEAKAFGCSIKRAKKAT